MDDTDKPKQSPHPTTELFKESCFQLRDQLRDAGPKIKALMKHPCFGDEKSGPDQHSEMKANIMLAYRHAEDAAMRLGKAIQA